MLVLTNYIARHELKPLERHIGIDDIIVGSQKIIKGLGVETKSPRRLSGLRFYKVRLGGGQSARMIVFVVVANQKIVPLMIRLKKDKIFGMNMAMDNPAVLMQINRNLDQVLLDIEEKHYTEFSL